MVALQIFWFIIFLFAVGAFAVLDGFDLGAGFWHLCLKTDHERRNVLNAIGPVWDGNEVWLVIVIGGMFAGFPYAYATLFSAFYLPLTVLICGLIFRAVAIEFRSKKTSQVWRQSWDLAFGISSLLISFLIGVALGNLIEGIPLNEKFDYTGSIASTFIKPYPLLIGLFVTSAFIFHSVMYLIMKTKDEMQQKLERWEPRAFWVFFFFYVLATIVTFWFQEHMLQKLLNRLYLLVIPLLNVIAFIRIYKLLRKQRTFRAFLYSCLNIFVLTVLFGVGTFPDLIRSTVNTATNSLTIYNASSSKTTMIILTVIVILGVPLVLAYFTYLYKVFRGKVELDETSY